MQLKTGEGLSRSCLTFESVKILKGIICLENENKEGYR